MARRRKTTSREAVPQAETGLALSDSVMDMVAGFLADIAREEEAADEAHKLARKRRAA